MLSGALAAAVWVAVSLGANGGAGLASLAEGEVVLCGGTALGEWLWLAVGRAGAGRNLPMTMPHAGQSTAVPSISNPHFGQLATRCLPASSGFGLGRNYFIP